MTLDPREIADAELARVAAIGHGLVDVVGPSGPATVSLGARVLAAVAANRLAAPYPGDEVVLRTWPDHRVTLELVLPRRTRLAWPTRQGPELLCANADRVGVVWAGYRSGVPGVRGLVDAARAGGSEPVVLLTGVRCDGEDEVGAPVLRVGPSGLGAGAAGLAAAGSLLALVGYAGQGRRAVVRALAGATPVRQTAGLLRVPGGGALLLTRPVTTGAAGLPGSPLRAAH